MQKLINDKIEILKEANKFNLVDITNEEIQEFREARLLYIEALRVSDDKRYIQRKFEAMLDEIADVLVVTDQWESPHFIRRQLLSSEENIYISKSIGKSDEYIGAVMLYKMERTILRNKVDWYKK